MFSFGAVVLGVLWVTAGVDAFLPFLTNVYMNSQGRAFGSAMSSSAPQTVCSWYNIPGYLNTASMQNAGNAGNNGWGSLWLNGMGNAGSSGRGNAGLPNSLPGLMALLGSVYSSSITGSLGQSGRPGFAVRVEETNPRGGGSNVSPPANTAGTRELDYYDQDAPYYYDDDYDYYGQDYTYSDPVEYADTVVYRVPQTEAPPTIAELLQTIYGSQYGTANTAGSNPCGACAASMLNMLMG